MTLSKKYIAGLATVAVATAYGLTRWRKGSADENEQAQPTASQSPADD